MTKNRFLLSDAPYSISYSQTTQFPRSQSLTGNVILEVLPPGIIEAEPLNYIPTQSMGTRCLNKCVQLAQTTRFPQIVNSLAFPRSQSLTGNVILEVLPPGTIEAEPLNYIPTQSMGTRCLDKCV